MLQLPEKKNTDTAVTVSTEKTPKATAQVLGKFVSVVNTGLRFAPHNEASFFRRHMLAVFMAVCALFSCLYVGLFATDRYVSHAELTVRTAQSSGVDVLGGLMGAIGGSSDSGEAYIVQNYVMSRDIVVLLQDLVDLRSVYSNPEADYLSRLPEDATDEELFEHYLERTEVVYDSGSQIITIDAQAFSAEEAQTIADTIVVLCDQLVNKISSKSRSDALRMAKNELNLAEARVTDSRLALSSFRQEYGELDPVASAAAKGAILAGLEAQLASEQTQISALRSYLKEGSTQVTAAKSRIAALKKQMNAERSKLQGQKQKDITSVLAEYERLKVEDEFSKQAYAAAATAMEMARIDASKKHLYLVAFVEPSLPDEATMPERLKSIGTILLCSVLVYVFLSMIFAAMREHSQS